MCCARPPKCKTCRDTGYRHDWTIKDYQDWHDDDRHDDPWCPDCKQGYIAATGG